MQSREQWRIEIETVVEGWLGIPEFRRREDLETWVETTTESIAPRLGADNDARVGIASIVVQAPERRRQDDLLAFQVWPGSGPWPMYVHFGVAANRDLPDFAALNGAEVRGIYAEGIGPGIQVTRRDRIEEWDAPIAHMFYLFSDRNDSLIVEVEAGPAPLIGEITPGLQSTLETLTLHRPDGSKFHATEAFGYLHTEDSSWDIRP